MKCYTESGYFFINGKHTISASNIRIILDKIGVVEYVTLQLISNNQNIIDHVDVTTLENASSVLYADYADFISQTQGSSGTTITGTAAVGGETAEGDPVTGNPIFIGAKAVDVEPASLTAGDLGGLITTLKKALIIAGYDYDLQSLNANIINPPANSFQVIDHPVDVSNVADSKYFIEISPSMRKFYLRLIMTGGANGYFKLYRTPDSASTVPATGGTPSSLWKDVTSEILTNATGAAIDTEASYNTDLHPGLRYMLEYKPDSATNNIDVYFGAYN